MNSEFKTGTMGSEMSDRLTAAEPASRQLDVATLQEPFGDVGGDLLTIHDLPDGKVFLGIADVCGKGERAACVAAEFSRLLDPATIAKLPLEKLIDSINQSLARTAKNGLFITFTGVIIDPATGRGTIVNAGHPPALIVNTSGQYRLLQHASHLPLALSDECSSCEQFELQEDETLVFYTDGLLDWRRADGSFGEIEDFMTIVGQAAQIGDRPRATDFLSRVVQRCDQFHGTSKPTDDRSLLVARRFQGTIGGNLDSFGPTPVCLAAVA